MKKEYMIHIWGGAFNSDAFPSIEEDLGITEGYYYFSTKEEKDDFCNLLNNPIYKNQGLMTEVIHGYMRHKRTIFVGTLKYKEKEFVIHYDFGYEFDEEHAIHMFKSGNFSCDCNRSLFIMREYGDDAIQEMNCGEEIKLLDYHFEYWD